MRHEGYELDYPVSAAQSAASDRAAFVRRVYGHLAGAVLALIGIEAILLNVLDQSAQRQILALLMGSRLNWLIVMLLFMGAGFVARIWAQSQTSQVMQYLGLGLYVVAWAVIFLPLLILANWKDPNMAVIKQAGILTGAVFGGLTLAVFLTRKDYSFLGPVLCVGSFVALGIIVAGALFGFSLGFFFSCAMVALISGYILFDTSNVMLHYPLDMHVAASLELLADVAMLFWYIVQILFMSNRD